MNNKGLLIAMALLVIVAGVSIYWFQRSSALSPPDEKTLTSGGVTVSVRYSRPSVRGRLIFGPEEQNALQPYGKYWRLGANKATEISFNRDILFNERPVSAGTYRMYAIPGPDSFEIILNTQVGESGSNPPDEKNDVLRVSVPTQKISAPVEQFTISLAPQGEGIQMVFEWSDMRFSIPLRAAN